MLRTGPLVALPLVIRALGHDPDEILADSGVSSASLADPDSPLSFAVCSRLLDSCARRLQCAHFGLVVGSRLELWHLGLLGVILRCSRNLQEALIHLIRYQAFYNQKIALQLEFESGMVRLIYRDSPGAADCDQVADCLLSGINAILRWLCGPSWKPSQVSFCHEAPEDTSPFCEQFKCPLVFSAHEYAISISPRWLTKEISDIEPGLLNILAKELEKNLRVPADDFISTVRDAIEIVMKAGKVNATLVSGYMRLPVRTLNRRLNQHGVSFQSLLDEVRYRASCRMLANSRIAVCRIAESLGYKETASFARAFRRWSGKSPNEWRVSDQIAVSGFDESALMRIPENDV